MSDTFANGTLALPTVNLIPAANAILASQHHGGDLGGEDEAWAVIEDHLSDAFYAWDCVYEQQKVTLSGECADDEGTKLHEALKLIAPFISGRVEVEDGEWRWPLVITDGAVQPGRWRGLWGRKS